MRVLEEVFHFVEAKICIVVHVYKNLDRELGLSHQRHEAVLVVGRKHSEINRECMKGSIAKLHGRYRGSD